MQRFTVIGLGRFGEFAATRLYQLGNEVIAIDLRDDVVDRLGPEVTRAVVGDGTEKAVLDELGVRDSTAAIIATGNLSASVLSLLALRDVGLRDIYVKVTSEEHRRIVDRLGASEAIFPEKRAGEALATRLTSGRLLRYVEVSPELSLQEMAVPERWIGKSLRDLDLPAAHGVQIVAVHDILRDAVEIPSSEHKLKPSDALLVAGEPATLARLAKLK